MEIAFSSNNPSSHTQHEAVNVQLSRITPHVVTTVAFDKYPSEGRGYDFTPQRPRHYPQLMLVFPSETWLWDGS